MTGGIAPVQISNHKDTQFGEPECEPGIQPHVSPNLDAWWTLGLQI
jgi:hypothetical protein